MKKLSQEQRVLNYLRTYGYITNKHAILKMGIWRLAAVIYILKKRNKIVLDKKASDYVRHKDKGIYKYVAKVIE